MRNSVGGALVALGLTLTGSIAQAAETPVYPAVVDATHTSTATEKFFTSYFDAKSKHDVAATMGHMSKHLVTYLDATLGWDLSSYDALNGLFINYMPKWPADGLSYPLKIYGGWEGTDGSAIVSFVNTPSMFGSELRVLAAVDVKAGKIVRWVDYWDGARFNANAYDQMRTPKEKFPKDFHEGLVGDLASGDAADISAKLQTAFSKADADAAVALFSPDAVFVDRSAGVIVVGRIAIQHYLSRIAGVAPYGASSKLRHVLGNARGGGFEWLANPASGEGVGITAISFNKKGEITDLETVYDTRALDAGTLQKLSVASQ